MKTDIPIGSVVMHISFPHRLGIVIGSEQCWNRKLGRGYMKYWIDWMDSDSGEDMPDFVADVWVEAVIP